MDVVVDPTASVIRRLTIERFRGIQAMEWCPGPGLNVILGGGDVGKTTILDAIGLLLCPTNFSTVSDSDYWNRNVTAEFSIEAVISLPDTSSIHRQALHAWPWRWYGGAPHLPDLDDDSSPKAPDTSQAVYRVRVRGTSDFELSYEILQPDGDADTFSVAVRTGIGLVRLGGDDRNDRDLRLIQGSALDRLLSDKALRARLGQALATTEMEDKLTTEAQERLRQLNEALGKRALPTGVGIGLTGGHGPSISALIGLTAAKDNIRLPLASWGAGTRRLVALHIAASYQGESPVILVDELERGLEPYRQRLLIESLRRGRSQVFLTTHSATAISASCQGMLWYVDAMGRIGPLDGDRVRRHQSRDPEAFLARLTIVAEGSTEVGFLSAILERLLSCPPWEHGIRVTDGEGNENTLCLIESLGASGMQFAGFADNEGSNPTRWAAIENKLGALLFRWPSGCLEENVVRLIPTGLLEELVRDPDDELTGQRLRTLADRLGIKEKDFPTVASTAPDIASLIIQAATGAIPADRDFSLESRKELKKHGQRWFKSLQGGRELATKAIDLGAWPLLEPQMRPFLNSIRRAIGLPELEGFPV
jgi:putative ATP-dependent endonuclease of the OLD family